MNNRLSMHNFFAGCVLTILFLFSYGKHLSAQNTGETENPNIILIYIDDMGYSDIAEYGKEYGQDFIETPNMDRLVNEGLKFTSGYSSSPLCSPSRAALLTGKTPARLNFEFVTKYEGDDLAWDNPEWIERWSGQKLIPPPYTLNLPLEEVTIAEALKENGYTTAITGKWHVAAHNQHYKGWSSEFGPEQQGFDFSAETFGAHPYSYTVGNQEKESISYEAGEFPEDELTNRAIDFIKMDHKNPFFLYVSHYYVHTPIAVELKWLMDKYREKADGEVSEDRILYAAFVEMLDHYIGQLLSTVEEQGIKDNTIVVLTSDNGGHPEFAYTRPFRGSKWNLYEGGVRVPFIVQWPGVVEAGSETDVPVSQIDLLPTFLEIANGSMVENNNIDGKSFAAILKNDIPDEKLNNRTLYWHFPYYHPEGQAFEDVEKIIGFEDGYVTQTVPHSSIRKGNLKLIYFYEDDKAELFDLSKDPSEKYDLSLERPWDTMTLKDELMGKLHDAGARFPRVKN